MNVTLRDIDFHFQVQTFCYAFVIQIRQAADFSGRFAPTHTIPTMELLLSVLVCEDVNITTQCFGDVTDPIATTVWFNRQNAYDCCRRQTWPFADGGQLNPNASRRLR